MHDTLPIAPDFPMLFSTASGQHGYFTTAQARSHGFSDSLIGHHVRSGKFIRVHQGIYRLRDYPSSPHEGIMAAWLAAGSDVAVVSHESALDLHELSDVTPHYVHLTIPRSKRYRSNYPGVKIHTTSRTLTPSDITRRSGIRMTSVPRTIVDAAEAGTGPEQIVLAIRQAIWGGQTTRSRLEAAVSGRPRRVQRLVHQGLEEVDR